MKWMSKGGPSSKSPMLLQHFERFESVWDRSSESFSSDYQIGRLMFRVCHGSSLMRLTRAIEHLRVESTQREPSLTICLWDAQERPDRLPSIDWPLLMKIPSYETPEGPIYFHWFNSIESLSLIHTKRKKAHYLVRDAKKLPWWVEGAPLLAILHAWLQNHELQIAHAGAIGNHNGALLLTGKGGSGKSTTVLSCVREGMDYIGEDHSILEWKKEPAVWSLYHSAKLNRQTRNIFPSLDAPIANPDSAEKEKALLYYRDLFPKQIQLSAPIRGIVSLSVGQEPSPILSSLEPPAAIQSLMASTLQQLPFCGPRNVHFFKRICQSIPCYRLVLGSDVLQNVQILKTLLDRRGRR
jgi:hypothetical protein